MHQIRPIIRSKHTMQAKKVWKATTPKHFSEITVQTQWRRFCFYWSYAQHQHFQLQVEAETWPGSCLPQKNKVPAQVVCGSGCCPFKEWTCCSYGLTCAISMDKCPVKGDIKEIDTTKGGQCCHADETSCLNGCCLESGWYCCPGGLFCASSSAANCPGLEEVLKKKQLPEMLRQRQFLPK